MKRLLLFFAALSGLTALPSAFAEHIELYMDRETKQIFAEPGAGRIKLGTFAPVTPGSSTSDSGSEKHPPAPATRPAASSEDVAPVGEAGSNVKVVYDKGFQIGSDAGDSSFAMKIGGRLQFRYTGFSRRDKTYVMDDGTSGESTNRNDFEIERGRLEFAGHVADPRLQYYLNLDFDTDDNHQAVAHDFWFNYKFSEAFNLHVGKAFVPGSRDWLDGSSTTHLSDRSLANSFFRPDRSLGVWTLGEPSKGLFYRAMMSNGFSTSDLGSDDIDTNFTYSTSVWGDIIGEFGSGRTDLEYHIAPAVRVGTSFTYSPITQPGGEPSDEADAIRLSNGVRLDDEGAVAPGVTVGEYDIFLYAVDFAGKYRGFSLYGELYFRALENLVGNGPISEHSYFDKGGFVDVGYFVVPKLIEPVLRYSYIDGELSDAYEYGAGVNWYVDRSYRNKFTLDVTRIDDSPTNTSGVNLRTGDTGLLYRLQWQIGF
jgi:hypothetical protein